MLPYALSSVFYLFFQTAPLPAFFLIFINPGFSDYPVLCGYS